jgi:hypothetical protein
MTIRPADAGFLDAHHVSGFDGGLVRKVGSSSGKRMSAGAPVKRLYTGRKESMRGELRIDGSWRLLVRRFVFKDLLSAGGGEAAASNRNAESCPRSKLSYVYRSE